MIIITRIWSKSERDKYGKINPGVCEDDLWDEEGMRTVPNVRTETHSPIIQAIFSFMRGVKGSTDQESLNDAVTMYCPSFCTRTLWPVTHGAGSSVRTGEGHRRRSLACFDLTSETLGCRRGTDSRRCIHFSLGVDGPCSNIPVCLLCAQPMSGVDNQLAAGHHK